MSDAFDPQPVTLELPGGRARLEPLEMRHAPGLLEAGADSEVWKYLPTRGLGSIEEARAFIGLALEARDMGRQQPFAIVDRPSGRLAGSTRYLDIQRENRALEIGWTWHGTPWQRTAINTECKYMLLRHAFEVLGAVRVQLKTDLRNLKSQRAIERIGGVKEGVMRKSRILDDGYIRDTVCYSVIEEEWGGVKSGLEAKLGRS